jgi:methylated-DNA-[protein]-cysteine S-methyltransferase
MIAYYSSPIGTLKITSDQGSISSIHFMNENTPDQDTEKDGCIEQCIIQLEEYFKGTRRHFDFPMQQKGTEFQTRVWNELLLIPYGKTTSYMAVSKQIGDVKAIRAVGTANGKNNLAIAVPCHRVIGSNARLVGYAGGLWRKQWLLEHEAKHANGLQTLF